MDLYKYLSWNPCNSKYWKGNLLLNTNQRISTIKNLLRSPKNQNIFTTVQDYTRDGDIVGSYIYADLDGDKALGDTRALVKALDDSLGSYPAIYFSGCRGFHIMVSYYIEHPFCHLIVKDIVQRFSKGFSLDLKVYTGRRLFRVPNTYHTTGDCYKIRLSAGELFTFDLRDINEIAKNPTETHYVNESIPSRGIEILDKLKEEAIDKLKHRGPIRTKTDFNNGRWQEELTPCLRYLIENIPDQGEINASLFILARFFKWHGVPITEALNIILSQEHYSGTQQHIKAVTKVFNSTYQSGQYTKIGCMYEPERTILLKHCHMLCPYNKEKLWFSKEK